VSVLCIGLATPVAIAFAAENDTNASTESQVKKQRSDGRTAAGPVGRKIDAVEDAQRRRRKAEQAVGDVPGGPSAETLAAIRACESGGDYAMDSGNGFYGAYQFMQGTWEAVGGSGNPAEASPAEQDKRAAMLYAQSGSGQWPVCGA